MDGWRAEESHSREDPVKTPGEAAIHFESPGKNSSSCSFALVPFSPQNGDKRSRVSEEGGICRFHVSS